MSSALSLEPRIEEKHRILAHLGQGGTSDVYLAVAQGPVGFNKLVVLKVLKKSLQNDAEFSGMFVTEARLAARLNHPNIVQTYEIIEDGSVSTMVMEYLEGRPLSALLQRSKQGELSLSMHLRIIADALAGLHYAHELKDFDGTPLGVVHRDATPHNIFVTFEGQVKVLDFGIAKLNVSSVETRTGMIKGKVRYMAPEQILCHPVDRRVDVYAAGVMLWQAAAGVPLWQDLPEGAILARVVNGDVPSPSTVRRDVHPSLERVCMKALSPDREARHATAAALEADIEVLMKELGDHVASRDVGRVVSSLFADLRESTRTVIEQQLSSASSRTWSGVRLPDAAILGVGDSSSRSETRGATTAVASAQRSRQRGLLVAGGAGLGLLALWLGLRPSPEPASAPEQSINANQASAAVAAPAPPANVRLRVRAVPDEARLYLDDQQLASNPFEQVLPRDGREHWLRVEANGYVGRSERVVLDRDTELSLTLEHLSPGASRSQATTPRGSVGRPAARERVAQSTSPTGSAPGRAAVSAAPQAITKAATAGTNCDKPFFIDERGIKRMLPECL